MICNLPRYVLGILNSSVIRWYFPKIATDLGKNGARYFKQFVELLPIPENVSISSSINDYILKQEYSMIDILLFKFYNFTEEEISILSCSK